MRDERSLAGRLAVEMRRGDVLAVRLAGRVLLTVGPYRVAVADGGGAWAVVDYQADPAGELVRCAGPVATAREALRRLWPLEGCARDLLARRDHARLFPLGDSLSWTPAPLEDWRPPAAWRRSPHRLAG